MKRKIPDVSITELWESFGGEVIGSDGALNRKAKCCLHNDSNASASINEEEGLWRCATCDVGGDAISLVREFRRVGFIDALTELERFAAGSNRAVQPERSRSGLLPGGSRGNRTGGAFVPPWRRF